MAYRSRTAVLLLSITVAFCAAVGAAEAPVSPAAPPPPSIDILQRIPAQAIGVVVVSSPAAVEASLTELVEPGGGRAIQSHLYMLYEGLLSGISPIYGEGEGIDENRALIMAILPGPDGDEPRVLYYVPLQDHDAWRAARAEEIQRDEEADLEYVEEEWGDGVVYFRRVGDYLAAANEGETLQAEGAAEGLPAFRVNGLLAHLQGSAVSVNFSTPALLAGYPEIMEKINAFIAGDESEEVDLEDDELEDDEDLYLEDDVLEDEEELDGEEDAEKKMLDMMRIYAVAGRDILRGLDQYYAGVRPDADSMRVIANVTAMPGSALARVMSEQRPIDLTDISLLPANRPAMIFAGGIHGDAAWQYLAGFYGVLVEAVADSPEQAQRMRTALTNMLLRVRQLGLADNFVTSLYRGPQDGALIESVTIYRTADPQAAIATVREIIADPDLSILSLKASPAVGVDAQPPQVTTEEIEGVEVTVITMPLGSAGAPPEAAEFMASLFGEALVTRLAPGRERIFAVLSSRPEATAEFLTGARTGEGLIDRAKVNRSLEGMGEQFSGAMLLSLPEYMLMMLSATPMLPVPMEDAVAPETERFIAASVLASGTNATLRLTVPVEQIAVTQQILQQMMTQMLGGHAEYDDGSDDPAERSRLTALRQIAMGIGMYMADNDGEMPPSLQALVDEDYVGNALLFLRPGQDTAEFDADDVDTTGAYHYGLLETPEAVRVPGDVPIVWEKEIVGDGVAVVMADFSVRVMPLEEFLAAIDAAENYYEAMPPMPTQVVAEWSKSQAE